MAKIIKENDLVVQEDTLKRDMQVLWAMLGRTAPEHDYEALDDKLNALIEKFPPVNFKYIGYDGYPAYEKKIPWYNLDNVTASNPRVLHAIIHIEKDDTKISVGYSTGNNALSFKKDDGDLKFYNFKNAKISGDIFNEFYVIMQRILR